MMRWSSRRRASKSCRYLPTKKQHTKRISSKKRSLWCKKDNQSKSKKSSLFWNQMIKRPRPRPRGVKKVASLILKRNRLTQKVRCRGLLRLSSHAQTTGCMMATKMGLVLAITMSIKVRASQKPKLQSSANQQRWEIRTLKTRTSVQVITTLRKRPPWSSPKLKQQGSPHLSRNAPKIKTLLPQVDPVNPTLRRDSVKTLSHLPLGLDWRRELRIHQGLGNTAQRGAILWPRAEQLLSTLRKLCRGRNCQQTNRRVRTVTMSNVSITILRSFQTFQLGRSVRLPSRSNLAQVSTTLTLVLSKPEHSVSIDSRQNVLEMLRTVLCRRAS